jgi:hypothetical protein
MRHDPASAAIVVMLRSLKMYGMAQATTELIEQGAPVFNAAVPILLSTGTENSLKVGSEKSLVGHGLAISSRVGGR